MQKYRKKNGDRWIVIDDGSLVCENRELPTEKKPRAGELSPTSTVYPSEEETEEPAPPTTDKKRPERTRGIRVSDYPESVTIDVIRKLLEVFEPKFSKTHESYEERLNQQSPAECQHILSRDLGLIQGNYRINPEVIQDMFEQEQSRLERSEQSSRAGDSIKDRKSKRDRDPREKKRRRRKSSAPAAKSQGGYDPDAHEKQAKKNRSRPSAPAAVKEEIKEEDDSSASKCSVKSSDFCDTDWRTNPKEKKKER